MLRWLAHLQRREDELFCKRSCRIFVEGRRSRESGGLEPEQNIIGAIEDAMERNKLKKIPTRIVGLQVELKKNESSRRSNRQEYLETGARCQALTLREKSVKKDVVNTHTINGTAIKC